MGGQIRVTKTTPKELGWPTYNEQARQEAQRVAAKKTNRANVMHYAVPHGKQPPREIRIDKRWRKRKNPLTVIRFADKKTEKFDIWYAQIKLFDGNLIAKGSEIWEKIRSVGELRQTEIRFGHILDGVFRPWDRFAKGNHTLIYLTVVKGRIWYYDSEFDAIRATSKRDWLDTITWGAFAKAGKSAEGMIMLYKSMVYFGMALVPGGFYLSAGITAASMAVFWDHHEKDIRHCYNLLENIVRAMRVIYRKAPMLGTAMLKVTVQESALKINEAAKKDGIVSLVLSNLDGEKFLQYIAEFFGVLLRLALTRHGLSGLAAKGLAKLGLKPLAKLVSSLRKVMKLWTASARVVTGGGIKDPQNLAANLMTIFAEAGVKLTAKESDQILSERGPTKPEVQKAIETLYISCSSFERSIVKLAQAAQDELF